MTKTLSLLLLSLLLTLCACTEEEKPVSPLTLMAEGKVVELEKDLASVEEKMKEAVSDQGLQVKLSHEREMIRARLGRWKLRIPPERLQKPAEASAGHH